MWMARLSALLLPLLLASIVTAERPKIKDVNGVELIKISYLGTSCGSDAYMGYGIVKGSLEKCDNYSAVETYEIDDKKKYEKYKCDTLRLHGMVDRSGTCTCKDHWKGAFCAEFHGCPEDAPFHHNGVCTAHICQNGGELAIGTKNLDCICPVPWDGRFCERLACWRKTVHGQEKRVRNDNEKKKCYCGQHYMGEQCNVVKSCEKGKFVSGRCECPEGWGGEICDKKCKADELTCSGTIALSSLMLSSVLFFLRH